jgi:hypothetical protein
MKDGYYLRSQRIDSDRRYSRAVKHRNKMFDFDDDSFDE